MSSQFRLFSKTNNILPDVSCRYLKSIVILVSLILFVVFTQSLIYMFGWRIRLCAEDRSTFVNAGSRKVRSQVRRSLCPWNKGLTFSSEEAGLSNGAVELDAK